VLLSWAQARLGDRQEGMTKLKKGIAAYVDQGNRIHVPFFQGLLAEIENEESGLDEALARIGDALALAEQTGERVGPTLSCTVFAARFCSSAIRQIRRRPRKPSSPPLRPRASKKLKEAKALLDELAA
jgi:hypothetical protein